MSVAAFAVMVGILTFSMIKHLHLLATHVNYSSVYGS